MNMFFRLTALAGLLAIAGQTFAVEDITRADQIPVLKEETQHATVSERVTSRFTRFSLSPVRPRSGIFGQNL